MLFMIPRPFCNNQVHHDQGVKFEMFDSVTVGQSVVLTAAATINQQLQAYGVEPQAMPRQPQKWSLCGSTL